MHIAAGKSQRELRAAKHDVARPTLTALQERPYRRRVLSGLRPIHVVRLLLLVLNTLVIAPLVTIIGLFERDCKFGYKFAQQWMVFNLWFSNVRVKVSGLENLDTSKQYIFMSNHRSAADIVAIGYALWAFQIRFVA